MSSTTSGTLRASLAKSTGGAGQTLVTNVSLDCDTLGTTLALETILSTVSDRVTS